MSETAIVGENVEVIQTGGDSSHTPFSWSAAIAGALAATAVAFIIVSLGSGVGLQLSSPYSSGPSLKTLTIIGAVWLVMAHAFAFATGGYLAARLRSPANDGIVDETRFRDAAQGFVAWALAVVAMVGVAGLTALFAAGSASVVAAGTAAGTGAAMSNPENANSASDATGYFVDMLFRPGPNAPAQTSPAPATTPGTPGSGQSLNAESRAEATRIVARGVAQGGLSNEDRAYLAQVVSQRTGLPPDQAQQRVTDVENKAKQNAKDAADKAAKAGSYFSFWLFMSLLFGAAAATLGGIVGGDLRDKDNFGRRAAAIS